MLGLKLAKCISIMYIHQKKFFSKKKFFSFSSFHSSHCDELKWYFYYFVLYTKLQITNNTLSLKEKRP